MRAISDPPPRLDVAELILAELVGEGGGRRERVAVGTFFSIPTATVVVRRLLLEMVWLLLTIVT